MSLLHARFLEPEALREHLRQQPSAPLEGTRDTGLLEDAAAAALVKVILSAGESGGAVDLDGAVDAWESRFLLLVSLALADDAAAGQLLEGGWLDRRGVGAHAFGSLPVRIIRRQLSRQSLAAAREAVQVGWESELLNVIESAALRAERAPEEHLVLLRHPGLVGTGTVTSSVIEELPELLGELRRLDAADLTFVAGSPPTVHGGFGARTLGEEPLTAESLAALLSPLVPSTAWEAKGMRVHTVGIRGLGRFRVTLTTERGAHAATVRALPSSAPPLDALPLSPLVQAPLLALKHGVVLLSGAPGSGRSTFLAAVLQRLVHEGRLVASLEEPLHLPLASGPGVARQFVLGVDTEADDFARATKLMPLDVVAFDLIDDGLALELALDAASDGRLALCTFRAPNVTAAVHRAALLDARFQRRRLADHLAAVCWQHLPVSAGRRSLEVDFHLPSVALRRHVRAHETPPPPVVFEPE